MMIFAQDKTTLVNSDRMSVFNVEPCQVFNNESNEFVEDKDGKYSVTVRDNLSSGWVTLGTYENEDIAKNVLNDICDEIIYEKNKRKRCTELYEMP